MNESNSIDQVLLEQFLDTLGAIPGVDVESGRKVATVKSGDMGWEVERAVTISGNPLLLLMTVRQSVFPSDAKGIMWQLLAASRGKIIHHTIHSTQSHDFEGAYPVPVLLAKSISSGAKELLRHRQVSYFDTGGSLFLSAPGIYFFVDKSPPKIAAASPVSLFSGKRAEVIHALLVNNERWFAGSDLAELTMASPATVSQLLVSLERLGWVESKGHGPAKQRRLRDPAALLDAWAKFTSNARPLSLRRYYVPGLKQDELVAHLSHVFTVNNVGYAVTHEMAAEHYTHHLTQVSQVRVRLTHSANTETAMAALGARVVSEGANLVIIENKSPAQLRFSEQVNGVWFASPIQIYLDLLCSEGRAKELAVHFRKERIGF